MGKRPPQAHKDHPRLTADGLVRPQKHDPDRKDHSPRFWTLPACVCPEQARPKLAICHFAACNLHDGTVTVRLVESGAEENLQRRARSFAFTSFSSFRSQLDRIEIDGLPARGIFRAYFHHQIARRVDLDSTKVNGLKLLPATRHRSLGADAFAADFDHKTGISIDGCHGGAELEGAGPGNL